MKILRVRRGFTTNSSGANEFLPDGGLYEGGTPPVRPSPTAYTPPPVLTAVQPWGVAPAVSPPASNGATIGAAALLVAGAFLVIPAVRLLRNRNKKKPDPAGPAPEATHEEDGDDR
jgi:hypothetical protein